MRLSKPALLLLISVIVLTTPTVAVASEKTIPSADPAALNSNERQLELNFGDRVQEPFLLDQSAANANVCYTLRTYKVERAERFNEDRKPKSSYTTCQMGSRFRFRSAVGDSRNGK